MKSWGNHSAATLRWRSRRRPASGSSSTSSSRSSSGIVTSVMGSPGSGRTVSRGLGEGQSLSARPRSPRREGAHLHAIHALDGSVPFATDVDLATLDAAATERCDDVIGLSLGDLDEREALGDLDAADPIAGKAGLVRDRADEVARPDAGPAPGSDEQARRRLLV